ncbi:SapC family protein [Pseudoxanthomonas sp. Root630]|uniref:SapC family protein n=1 Tax=Pseudoxanthomonas sp. Root630 TaxID=1736574 RepID=UPI00070322CF|nr:SapC family protein [Pseudoxanthomonas sp. Root630]KRA47456.1 peptide ABC transporter permease [Pseudoxanthomonas sp. Root630]
MARYELLNNVSHKDLRIATSFGPEFGDDVGMVPAFPSEFAELQREYPIFLRKDPGSGEWQSVALLGFEQRENLFLRDGRWNASYLPGAAAKGPFLIGYQEQHIDGELRQEAVMHVDVEHPRVNLAEGEPVFLPHGGNTPYLEHIAGVLRGIRDGSAFGAGMFAALDAAGLVQPVNLDVQLDKQHRVAVSGLYGIDRERLVSLDGPALLGLNRAGYLEGTYLMLASLHNVRRLMAEKQRRLRVQDAAPSGKD